MTAMIVLSQWREIELICELWRPIKYRTGYEISNLGRIRSFRRSQGVKGQQGVIRSVIVTTPRILSPNSGGHAYDYLHTTLPREEGGLRRKYSATHRLVAETFLERAEGLNQVNHKNGYRKDPRLWNLEWTTHSGNQRHAHEHLNKGAKMPRGEDHHGAKFKARSIRDIRYLHDELGWSQNRIAQLCGIRASEINKIVHRQVWTHI